jgi:hypothetical protein
MRTTITISTVLTAMALTGCGTPEVRDTGRIFCRNRTVNVVNAEGELRVNPELVRVCQGYMVSLQFSNTAPPANVSTRVAGGSAPWLDKDSTTADGIQITADGAIGSEHKYSLTVEGIGMLDPRVVIQ